MSDRDYPKLRNIEAFPVQVSGQNLICLRDPMNFSKNTLVVSPQTFFIIRFFDGTHSLLDIQAEYMREFGNLLFQDDIIKIIDSLDTNLFLDSPHFSEYCREVESDFTKSPLRKAIHVGLSYDSDATKLKDFLNNLLNEKNKKDNLGDTGSVEEIKGAVIPHIDLQRGGGCYACAYREIMQDLDTELFIILGTAHNETKGFFILTEKDFETPLGIMKTDRDFVKLVVRDCRSDLFQDEFVHRGEHSIEFQVLFLQHIFAEKKGINIVPILCGSFHEMISEGLSPIKNERVSEFINDLKNVVSFYGKKACIIASADLAHVGQRFGDPYEVTGSHLKFIEEEDREMIGFIERMDAEGFFNSIEKDKDRRKICGMPSIYTLLNTINASKGTLLNYSQWGDPAATVTFASIVFK